MELSIGPRIFQGINGNRESIQDCMDFCAEAGFRIFDFGVSSRIGSFFMYEDDWERQAKELAEYAQKKGYVFGQSHAPYAYSMYPDREYYREMTRRSFEIARILGAKYIVVHAELRDDPKEDFDGEKAFRRAYEFYAPFAELASKLGIGMAIENLFDFKRRWNYTATVEEQIAIIDSFHDSNVTACWDVGHSHVMYGADHLQEMKKLGKRITCTHVHDNSQKKDLHLPPYFGDIRWDEVMGMLKEIGYEGNFNLELKVSRYPEPFLRDYLCLIYQTAQSIVQK